MKNITQILSTVFILVTVLQGCTSVTTFPTVARAGDTISVMVGGSEKARKQTIQVQLNDSAGGSWDLQALGSVRSVFNLRTDGRAEGHHYSSYLESFIAWSEGHETMQTVLVVNIPGQVPAGVAQLIVNTQVDDDSSGITPPFTINIEVLPGTGNSDNFLRQDAFNGQQPVDFSRLEPAPHAKINFNTNEGLTIGAFSLVLDFDETILDPADINVYSPESTVRGSVVTEGEFGRTQRMIHWRQDGQQLYINGIAPQGILQTYLMLYVMHPRGLSGSPNFNITSSQVYDTTGYEMILTPTMEYYSD